MSALGANPYVQTAKVFAWSRKASRLVEAHRQRSALRATLAGHALQSFLQGGDALVRLVELRGEFAKAFPGWYPVQQVEQILGAEHG